MRIFTEHRIENGLAAGNKGIPINGESVKVRCPAAILLFIRRYIDKAEPLNNEFYLLKVRFEMQPCRAEPPGQYPEFSGSKLEPGQT